MTGELVVPDLEFATEPGESAELVAEDLPGGWIRCHAVNERLENQGTRADLLFGDPIGMHEFADKDWCYPETECAEYVTTDDTGYDDRSFKPDVRSSPTIDSVVGFKCCRYARIPGTFLQFPKAGNDQSSSHDLRARY